MAERLITSLNQCFENGWLYIIGEGLHHRGGELRIGQLSPLAKHRRHVGDSFGDEEPAIIREPHHYSGFKRDRLDPATGAEILHKT